MVGTQHKMVFGIFPHQDQASRVVEILNRAGYEPKDISIVMKADVKTETKIPNVGESITKKTTSGAAVGGAVGAVTGLLMGIGILTIPGIGGLLIGGPIAAALGVAGAATMTVEGAITGALAGGLLGGLAGLGLPNKVAKMYEEQIREGGVLVAVSVYQDEEEEVGTIFKTNGASDINTLPINL